MSIEPGWVDPEPTEVDDLPAELLVRSMDQVGDAWATAYALQSIAASLIRLEDLFTIIGTRLGQRGGEER